MKRALTIVLWVGAWAIIVSVCLKLITDHKSRVDPTYAAAHQAPIPVQVAAVSSGPIQNHLGASGVVYESELFNIVAPFRGVIESVSVRVGDHVEAGQELFRFDDELPISELNLAKAMTDVYRNDMKHVVATQAKVGELHAAGMATDDDFNEILLQANRARRDYAKALHELIRTRRVSKMLVVTAPTAGVVTELGVYPGGSVAADSELAKLSNLESVLVRADLSEDRLGTIHVGQKVATKLPSYPGRDFGGEIVRIGPSFDPESRTVPAFIRIPNPDRYLKPGMSSVVQFSGDRESVRVPAIALLNSSEDSTAVFTVANGRARLQPVTVGVRGLSYVEVRDGVSAGDMVVVAGQQHLSDDSEVLFAE